MMDPKLWERIEAICFAALERPPADRAAFLEEACAGEPELRREVESLLEQVEADPDFLETPIARVTDLAVDDAVGEAQPSRYIAEYRLVRPLGRGGMGEVYLAVHEAEGFQQTVALKVIKRGMDTDEVLKRFHLERQILASLHHPNIALLLDGGATDDGRPYFVMEHVEGLPIDEFCDRRRLPVKQRLELFQVICSAVQHAHANLVVHRDLKPSNVHVTTEGVPKLLDFGIGKVLAQGPSRITPVETRTDVRILTPEYAAPEQVRGEPVTTATDVYGLGVLLYELLTGHYPYAAGAGSLDEIERIVCDAEPRQPSAAVGLREDRRGRDGSSRTVTPDEVSQRRGTDPQRLRRKLSGDLDNIVLKALRKEPERRYASATALADDIQRHLEGLPVKARPDTLAYRAGKFLRRHGWAVAAASVVFVALGSASVWTFMQSQRVSKERDKALEIQGFLLETFGAGGADQATADTVTVRQLLDGQAAGLEASYGERPELMAAMLAVLAEGYDRLGLYREAEPLARRALAIRREIHGGQHPDVGASTNSLGWILFELDQTDEAEPLLREAVRIRRAGGKRDRAQFARALNDLAVVRLRLGDTEEAETLIREALALRLAVFGEDHRSVGVSASNLSAVLYQKGDLEGAVRMAEQALRALRSSLGPDHQRTGVVQGNLASMKAAMGDPKAAELDYRDLLERQTRVHGREHPLTTQTMFNLASVLSYQERYEEAEPLAREVLAIREATLGDDHRDVAATLIVLGRARSGQRDYEGAVAALERALAIERESYDEAQRFPESLVPLAQVYERKGDLANAERLRREAIRIYEEILGPEHLNAEIQRNRLGVVLLKRGHYQEAATALDQAHRAALRSFADHILVHTTRLNLAQAQIGLGNLDVADSLLAESQAAAEAGKLTASQENLLKGLQRRLQAKRDSLAARSPL